MYLYGSDEQLAGWHGFGEPAQSARQVYAAQSRVRELSDRTFQTMFADRDKVIVVAFWASSCRSCDAVANTVVAVAETIAQGAFANRVKFYHAQWDPAVNPRLHRQYGFAKIPVVYFYYTGSGQPPNPKQPLLEAAEGGNRFDTDASKYLRNIETILRRHGHILPSANIAESRGWTYSRYMIESGDLADVDRMLVASSPVQRYLVPLARANPWARLARIARIIPPSSFDVEYQRLHSKRPDTDTKGTVDRQKRIVFLRAERRLQCYLNSALHEGVHLFSCNMQTGHDDFYFNYGPGLTEGFTQLVTEKILAAQKVRMEKPPYARLKAVADKFVEKLGFDAVADDYFRCTRNVHTRLEAARLFGPYVVLRRAAETADTDGERDDKYLEIIRLLDQLPGPRQ